MSFHRQTLGNNVGNNGNPGSTSSPNLIQGFRTPQVPLLNVFSNTLLQRRSVSNIRNSSGTPASVNGNDQTNNLGGNASKQNWSSNRNSQQNLNSNRNSQQNAQKTPSSIASNLNPARLLNGLRIGKLSTSSPLNQVQVQTAAANHVQSASQQQAQHQAPQGVIIQPPSGNQNQPPRSTQAREGVGIQGNEEPQIKASDFQPRERVESEEEQMTSEMVVNLNVKLRQVKEERKRLLEEVMGAGADGDFDLQTLLSLVRPDHTPKQMKLQTHSSNSNRGSEQKHCLKQYRRGSMPSVVGSSSSQRRGSVPTATGSVAAPVPGESNDNDSDGSDSIVPEGYHSVYKVTDEKVFDLLRHTFVLWTLQSLIKPTQEECEHEKQLETHRTEMATEFHKQNRDLKDLFLQETHHNANQLKEKERIKQQIQSLKQEMSETENAQVILENEINYRQQNLEGMKLWVDNYTEVTNATDRGIFVAEVRNDSSDILVQQQSRRSEEGSTNMHSGESKISTVAVQHSASNLRLPSSMLEQQSDMYDEKGDYRAENGSEQQNGAYEYYDQYEQQRSYGGGQQDHGNRSYDPFRDVYENDQPDQSPQQGNILPHILPPYGEDAQDGFYPQDYAMSEQNECTQEYEGCHLTQEAYTITNTNPNPIQVSVTPAGQENQLTFPRSQSHHSELQSRRVLEPNQQIANQNNTDSLHSVRQQLQKIAFTVGKISARQMLQVGRTVATTYQNQNVVLNSRMQGSATTYQGGAIQSSAITYYQNQNTTQQVRSGGMEHSMFQGTKTLSGKTLSGSSKHLLTNPQQPLSTTLPQVQQVMPTLSALNYSMNNTSALNTTLSGPALMTTLSGIITPKIGCQQI